MIKRFIERWEARKQQVRAEFSAAHPGCYDDIIKAVVSVLADGDDGSYLDWPDADRITRIDHGDYQGTLLFVVAASGYQPSTYWAVDVGYGSCSGCDTLESIREYSDEPPTPEQVDNYMTLALHVVQGLKRIAGYGADEES